LDKDEFYSITLVLLREKEEGIDEEYCIYLIFTPARLDWLDMNLWRVNVNSIPGFFTLADL
jgi:hypothetical protein